MELKRFRFGEQAGANGRKVTFNGWISVFEQDPENLHIETAGPKGGVRAGIIIDKETAGKLGAVLAPDLLKSLKSARLMLHAWRESRKGVPHPELDREIISIEAALAAVQSKS